MKHPFATRFLSVVVTMVLIWMSADFSVFAKASAAGPVEIKFNAALGMDATDVQRTMWYTDDYFTNSSLVYNPSLATASICLAMSAFGSNTIFSDPKKVDYTKAPVNFKDLMGKLGCVDIDVNTNPQKDKYYESQPDMEHVAFGIARKTVIDAKGEANLIIVGVRGSNYESEWASNVKVGAEGDHEGFSSAAMQVIGGLRNYINKYGLTDKRVKLWISGYSRAAATSNMTAGYLNQWIDNPQVIQYDIGAKLAKEDLYAYTFETPAGSADPQSNAKQYHNIFNFVNPNDLVPKVAPYFNGDDDFRRFGIDCFLPSSISEADNQEMQKRMVTLYEQDKRVYEIDKFRVKFFSLANFGVRDAEIGQHSAAAFVNDFLNELIQNGIESRQKYVARYQAQLMTAMGFLNGCTQYGSINETQKFMAYITSAWNYAWPTLSIIPVLLDTKLSIAQKVEKIQAVITDFLKSAKKATNAVHIPDSELEAVGAALGDVMGGLMTQVKEMEIIKTVDMMLSLFYNVYFLLQAHDPDLCFAWLLTMDPNYQKGTPPLDYRRVFHSGEYRILMVWGRADVTVERLKNGGVTSQFQIDDNGNITGDAALGEAVVGIRPTPTLHNLKYFYFPANGHYRAKISNKASVVYSVSEYSPYVGDIKRLFTYEQQVPKASYVADFPAFTAQEQKDGIPQGSSYNYMLQKGSEYKPDGEYISLPYKDLHLTQIRRNYVRLEVDTNQIALGMASGGGSYRRYSVALLQAAPTQNGEFLGWRRDHEPALIAQHEIAVPAYLDKQTYTAVFAFVGAPENVRAVQRTLNDSSTHVAVSWATPKKGNSDWIVGYQVYRRAKGAQAYTLLGTADASARSYLDSSGLTPGTTYEYAVETVARDPQDYTGTICTSKQVSVDITLGNHWLLTDKGVTVQGYSLGPAPTRLTVESCAQNDSRNRHMIQLSGSSFVGSYAMNLSDNSSYIQSGLTVTLPVTSYPDGTDILMQQDVDVGGSGDVRNESIRLSQGGIRFDTQNAELGQFYLTTLTKPGQPQNPEAYNSAVGTTRYAVTVEWAQPAASCIVDDYAIYRSDLAFPLGVVDPQTFLFVDDSVEQGKTYTYRIFARNGAGDSIPAEATVEVSNFWSLSATDSTTGDIVTVFGYSEGAAPDGLSVTSCTQGDSKNANFKTLIGEDYLGSWTVELTGNLGNIKDGYFVTLPVNTAKDGQSIHVQQEVSVASTVDHMNGEANAAVVTIHTDTVALGQFYATALSKQTAPVDAEAMVSSLVFADTPQFTLTWKPPQSIGVLDHYCIYRDGKPIGQVQATQTSFIDKDSALVSATPYLYEITASNGQFEGAAAVCMVSSVRNWSFSQNGVTVSGLSDQNPPTMIEVMPLEAGDWRLKHMQATTTPVLGRFAVSFPMWRPVDTLEGVKLSVSLPVPSGTNGKPTLVQHDRDVYGNGNVEAFEVTAQSSQSTVTVDDLSPFQVSGEVEKAPVTGDENPIWLWGSLGAISLLALLAQGLCSLKKRGRRNMDGR